MTSSSVDFVNAIASSTGQLFSDAWPVVEMAAGVLTALFALYLFFRAGLFVVNRFLR